MAAIEFLPVIALAALGTRTIRNGVALAIAVGGVYLLTGVQLHGGLRPPPRVLNAGLFALYIVLAHRVARLDHLGGIDGLAAAMLVAAVVVTPIGGWSAVPAFADPVALAAAVGVAVTHPSFPTSAISFAMASMARSTYALFVSLLPATATVVGVVVLAQLPTPIEVVAIALVIGGVALHQERLNA